MIIHVTSPADLHDKHFEAQLSSQLTEKLQADDLDGMLTALRDAELSTDHLSYHISCDIEHQSKITCWGQNASKTSHDASFSRVAHLCMLMQCRKVLRYISTQHPQHLMLSDKSSSGLLHSLAMANVLIRNSPTNCRLSDGFDTFQTDAFSILRDAECTNSLLHSSSSLLHSLCLMENASGLRPLEFAMLIGAYSTFQHILNVHGYILMKEVNHGIRIRSTYNLHEYDLMNGERRDKSPMLMLSLISSDQADALTQSGLLDAPVIKKWMKSVADDMFWTVQCHMFALLVFSVSFSPVSFNFVASASMLHLGYQLQLGFYEFSNLVKSQLNGTVNMSAVESTVRKSCTTEALMAFLTADDSPENNIILVRSSIFPFEVSRKHIVSGFMIVLPLLGSFLCFRLAVIVFNIVRNRQLYGNCWMPRRANFLVQTRFFSVAYILSFCSGFAYIVTVLQLFTILDCSDYVLGLSDPTWQLTLLVNVSECAAVLYMFFNLFSLIEAFEMVIKHVAFLSICLRKMLTKFILVLPLFAFWAYLVFGTLFYMADFKGQ